MQNINNITDKNAQHLVQYDDSPLTCFVNLSFE